MPGPLPPSRAESSSRARARAAARWTLACATLLAPFSPALGAAPARYVELRAGAAVETTIGSGFGAAPVSTVAVGLQLRDWFAAEGSVGVIDATLRDQGIALPGQTYFNRPYTRADVRVVAVPLALTARLVLPSDRVSPFALAGVGFAVAHAVATPELDGPIQREDFPSFGEKAPYFYFLLGTRNDAKGIASVNHSATFDVDEDALPLGVRALATLAWDFLAKEK